MRCALVTLGSRGDVEPFILLAAALSRRGHTVTLVLDEGHHALPSLAIARAATPIDVAMLGSLASDEMVTTVQRAVAATSPLERSRAGYHGFVGHRRDALRARVAEVATSHDVLVLSDSLAFLDAGRMPWPTPTAIVWYTLAPDADFRRFVGVPCTRIVALPAFVAPRDPALASELLYTGFWWAPSRGVLSSSIEEFLAAGTPPVFVTMGSMTGFDTSALVHAVVAAASDRGLRVVVQGGWARLRAPDAPGVFAIDEVDYAALFPRCAAVFVHGGTGTVGHALLASRPICVLPLVEDQLGWARILAMIGASIGTIDPRAPDPAAIGLALDRIRDRTTADAAARIAAALVRDAGIDAACDAIGALT